MALPLSPPRCVSDRLGRAIFLPASAVQKQADDQSYIDAFAIVAFAICTAFVLIAFLHDPAPRQTSPFLTDCGVRRIRRRRHRALVSRGRRRSQSHRAPAPEEREAASELPNYSQRRARWSRVRVRLLCDLRAKLWYSLREAAGAENRRASSPSTVTTTVRSRRPGIAIVSHQERLHRLFHGPAFCNWGTCSSGPGADLSRFLYFMCDKKLVPVPEKEIRQVLPPLHVLPFPLQALSKRVVPAIFHQNRVPERYPR